MPNTFRSLELREKRSMPSVTFLEKRVSTLKGKSSKSIGNYSDTEVICLYDEIAKSLIFE